MTATQVARFSAARQSEAASTVARRKRISLEYASKPANDPAMNPVSARAPRRMRFGAGMLAKRRRRHVQSRAVGRRPPSLTVLVLNDTVVEMRVESRLGLLKSPNEEGYRNKPGKK